MVVSGYVATSRPDNWKSCRPVALLTKLDLKEDNLKFNFNAGRSHCLFRIGEVWQDRARPFLTRYIDYTWGIFGRSWCILLVRNGVSPLIFDVVPILMCIK